MQARLRNDPFLEQVARREWAKLCRSLAIGAAGAGLPNLWLELRPTRAIAAQPRVDAEAVTLLVGVEAETRIVAKETKPECPFPATLEILPQGEQGRVNIAVPIDVPFTEVNRLMEAQFAGKTFSDDNAFAVTVRRASVAASGDRLLISLRVNATERKSWFGLGTEANVYVWGRPVLDAKAQVLRLTDVVLDVESEGMMGAAVRAAAPYLEAAVAERTVIDLKPFAANARKSIEAAIAEFRGAGDGVRVDASVTDLRVVDIAFDATTLAHHRRSRRRGEGFGDVAAEASSLASAQAISSSSGPRFATCGISASCDRCGDVAPRQPLVHVHHERGAEQRRREVEDRDRHEGGEEQSGDEHRALVRLAQLPAPRPASGSAWPRARNIRG